MKIFLERNNSKRSTDTDAATNVSLRNSHKLLPQTGTDEWVSPYEIYKEERNSCRKLRLTCQINVIASNVLHNSITEIVKNEGSGDTGATPVKCLNYGMTDGKDFAKVVGKDEKTTDFWSTCDGGQYPLEAIRDTQLNNSDCEFVYHPGKDIFNNHLIRSLTFKPVCIAPNHKEFNTIADFIHQEYNLKVNSNIDITEYIPKPMIENGDGNSINILNGVHIYKFDDILSYEDSLNERLLNDFSGWFGFKNRSKLDTFLNFNNTGEKSLNINKPINTANAGDFIDMYPGRDLFSFVPKYNKFRHRLEKNWNYCLTYPSSSTTKVSFIETAVHEETGLPNNALKAYCIDENTTDDSGTNQLVIYSISKHGLQMGDIIDVYLTNEVSGTPISSTALKNVEVKEIIDDYIFTVFPDGMMLSMEWVDLESKELNKQGDNFTVEGRNFKIVDTYVVENTDKGEVRYPIVNHFVNIDPRVQNVSYKKISGEAVYEYYVRIFSKLPNFRYTDKKVSEFELYKEGSTLISDFQTHENEFESHASKLGFSKNIYGDDIGQIVFTDDITFGDLKDNRKRPLTSLYLTLFKNNSGYKEWYGKAGKKLDIGNEKVEFSHCFGKLNCGFVEYEDSIYLDDENDVNIHSMTNATDTPSDHNTSGLSTVYLNNFYDREGIDDDEINYLSDKHFYGDLVCYDPLDCTEIVIQPVMFRFNTAQREINQDDASFQYFNDFFIDEIKYDDLDFANSEKGLSAFEIKTQSVRSKFSSVFPTCQRPEGYFYMPHYEIPIREFGEIQSLYPMFLDIISFKYVKGDFEIQTLQHHFLSLGSRVIFYDTAAKKLYYGETLDIYDSRRFVCRFTREDGTPIKLTDCDAFSGMTTNNTDIVNYRLFKVESLGIPAYAEMMRDGSCRYLWREVIQNGMNKNSKIEEYPFTNGSLYANVPINLHVRRQDPYGRHLWVKTTPNDPRRQMDIIENNYIEEEEIKC